jgi:hypothetical protein
MSVYVADTACHLSGVHVKWVNYYFSLYLRLTDDWLRAKPDIVSEEIDSKGYNSYFLIWLSTIQ